MDHLAENGFNVESKPTQNLALVKNEYAVPQQVQACHTAVIDGYVVEGHVPAEDIQRMLAERPNIAGLAVAGMPVGSPGMDAGDATTPAYDVMAFGQAGLELYATHDP